jgi:ketosteroid isomerase-like protein
MSQENVELARRASWAWNEGGVDALLEYLDPDVEWHPPADSMEAGVYRGHDGVRDYLSRPVEIFEEARVEPLEVIDVDDHRVISVIRVIARSENFGEIDAELAWLVTLGANRKVIRVETFTGRAQALEAVGLPEP